MKRRLNIGCAIIHKPELLILDEPTVGIDPQSRNHILDFVEKINKQGTTVIYTSHYMEEVERVCSRVCIMDAGQVIADGTVDEIARTVTADEVFTLEVKEPALSRILEATPANEILGVSAKRTTLEDAFLSLTGKTLRDGGEAS
jgi:ABC-2 type transport system ATP-binding protein